MSLFSKLSKVANKLNKVARTVNKVARVARDIQSLKQKSTAKRPKPKSKSLDKTRF